MPPKIKMTDVARQAGVSTATVGRVLHGRGYVSAEARSRVEAVLASTGFQLNRVAQSLRRSRTMTIGHLLTGLVPNPFFAGVEIGVEAAAIEQGYNVLIWNVLSDNARERAGVEAFLQRQVDAMIFTTPQDEEPVRLALAARIPVVQVERPKAVETHQVLCDNEAGARQAAEHLLALGHRRIALIGALAEAGDLRPAASVERQRLAGYQAALAAAGIQPDAGLIRKAHPYSIEEGTQAMVSLLAREPAPTAALVTSDITAAGVLQALYARGLRVPEDLSVIGFDDTYAAYLSPPLTSVALPVHEIGRAAARLAIQAAREKMEATSQPAGTERQDGPWRVETVRTELVIRASTGPVKG